MSLASIGLSAPGASATPAARGSGGDTGNGNDDGFSRMLQGGAREAPRAGPPGAGRRTEAGARDPGQRQAPASSEAPADGPDAATAAAAAGTGGEDAADAGPDSTRPEDAAGAWPPPGLAWLLDPAVAAPREAAAPAGAAQSIPVLAAQGAGPGMAASAGNPAVAQSAAPGSGGAPLPGPAASPGPMELPATAQTGEASAPAAAAAEGLADALAPLRSDAAVPAAQADGSVAAFTLPTPAPPVAAAATPAVVVSAADAPVPDLHGDAFADGIGSHVQWLAGQKIGHAHIRISPQELGPVEIRLQLDGDRISADFSSAQPEVRQALEHSLPRLREMLGQHGFELAHAGVGQQPQSSREGGEPATGGTDGDGGATTADGTAAPAPRPMRLGLLDAYA